MVEGIRFIEKAIGSSVVEPTGKELEMRKIARRSITARGGSKRIPKKNIKNFCGKPILAYSIEAAINSGVFSEVMVSTDNKEIAEIAQYYGASVPFMRSATTSNDYSTTEDVLIEVLNCYKARGQQYELICCILPTAPFVTAGKLKSAVAILEDQSDIDSVIPVVRFSFPPQRGLIVNNGYLVYQYAEYAVMRSQDLRPIYHDCGQFYVCRETALRKYHDLITPKSTPFILSEEEVQDIDDHSDWRMAELKYKTLNATKED